MAKNKKQEKLEFDRIAKEIKVENIKEFLTNNYLPYSHYVIKSRALVGPDGLKPVQQRGLWGLWDLKGFSDSKTIKANTVYGHVVGHFHPHGPASVSEAMAKLGQTFTSRVPLLEVQGSVGHQTGDSPAADRYYEIKLNKAAEALLEDVKYHAAVMINNYSDTEKLPAQLPAKWPFAVINGGQGIAVGYSTYMIPHNPTEVMDAIIKRMTGKINSTKQLMKVMKGPDFPTGGLLLGVDGIADYYETGKGSFLVRSKYEIDVMPRGRHRIVFTEFPYQISIEKIISEIKKKQQKNNELTDISETKNLSDGKRGNILQVIVKAGANPHIVLEELFKHTSLETRFSVNNTVLIDGSPRVVGVMGLIDNFINFRTETFIRKKEYRLSQIQDRLNRAEGLSKVILDLDKTIEIIRNSDTSKEAQDLLMKEFGINEEQAKYILELRLSVLTKSDRDKILAEMEALKKEAQEIDELLQSEELLQKALVEEMTETKKLLSDTRRTEIFNITSEELAEAAKDSRAKMKLLNNNADSKVYYLANDTVIMSLDETFNNHVPIKYELNTTTKANLNVLHKDGTISEISAEAISIDQPTSAEVLGSSPDKISSILPSNLKGEYTGVLIVTNYGNVNIIKNNIKSPLVKLLIGEEIVYSKVLTAEDMNSMLYIIAKDGQLAKFPVNLIRESNPGSGTVAGFKYNEMTVGAIVAHDDDVILSISNKTIKQTAGESVPATNRGVKGSRFHILEENDEIIGLFANVENKIVSEDSENLFIDITERAKKGQELNENVFFGY